MRNDKLRLERCASPVSSSCEHPAVFPNGPLSQYNTGPVPPYFESQGTRRARHGMTVNCASPACVYIKRPPHCAQAATPPGRLLRTHAHPQRCAATRRPVRTASPTSGVHEFLGATATAPFEGRCRGGRYLLFLHSARQAVARLAGVLTEAARGMAAPLVPIRHTQRARLSADCAMVLAAGSTLSLFPSVSRPCAERLDSAPLPYPPPLERP